MRRRAPPPPCQCRARDGRHSSRPGGEDCEQLTFSRWRHTVTSESSTNASSVCPPECSDVMWSGPSDEHAA
ncbi:hypothetical protein MTP99_010753 [Tenebrio molitor]|nr:hypothetical protein MTP99_010753 [Tenebrio molitor]